MRDHIRFYGFARVKVNEDFKWYYPYDELAFKVLVFISGDNQDIIALKMKYDKVF